VDTSIHANRSSTDELRYGLSTINCKIIGFTSNQYDDKKADIVVSIDSGALKDNYVDALNDNGFEQPDSIEIGTLGDIIDTDQRLTPENIRVDLFDAKKGLNDKLKSHLDKDQIKEHNANGAKLSILLNLTERVWKSTEWNTLDELRNIKNFKEGFLEDKGFVEAVVYELKRMEVKYKDDYDFSQSIKDFEAML
jgi:hypothetical protein